MLRQNIANRVLFRVSHVNQLNRSLFNTTNKQSTTTQSTNDNNNQQHNTHTPSIDTANPYHPIRSALLLSILLVPIVGYSILTVDQTARQTLKSDYPTVYNILANYLPADHGEHNNSHNVIMSAGEKIGSVEQQLHDAVESSAAAVMEGKSAIKQLVSNIVNENNMVKDSKDKVSDIVNDGKAQISKVSDQLQSNVQSDDNSLNNTSSNQKQSNNNDDSNLTQSPSSATTNSILTDFARARLDESAVSIAESNAAKTQQQLTESARSIRLMNQGEENKENDDSEQQSTNNKVSSPTDSMSSPVYTPSDVHKVVSNTAQKQINNTSNATTPNLDQFISQYADKQSNDIQSDKPAVYESSDVTTRQLETAQHQLKQLIQPRSNIIAAKSTANKSKPDDSSDKSGDNGSGSSSTGGGGAATTQSANDRSSNESHNDIKSQSKQTDTNTSINADSRTLNELNQHIKQLNTKLLSVSGMDHTAAILQQLHSITAQYQTVLQNAVQNKRNELQNNMQKHLDEINSALKSDYTNSIKSDLAAARQSKTAELQRSLINQYQQTVQNQYDQLQQQLKHELDAQKSRLLSELELEQDERQSILCSIKEHVNDYHTYLQQQQQHDAIASRVHKLSESLLALNYQLTTSPSDSFTHQWSLLRSACSGDALIETAIQSVPQSAVNEGVLTTQQLTRAFTLLEKQSAALALVGNNHESQSSIWNHITSKLLSLITVNERILVQGGNDDFSRLQRAQYYINQHNDLNSAVKEIDQFENDELISTWHNFRYHAHMRLLLNQALAVIHDRLAVIGSVFINNPINQQ